MKAPPLPHSVVFAVLIVGFIVGCGQSPQVPVKAPSPPAAPAPTLEQVREANLRRREEWERQKPERRKKVLSSFCGIWYSEGHAMEFREDLTGTNTFLDVNRRQVSEEFTYVMEDDQVTDVTTFAEYYLTLRPLGSAEGWRIYFSVVVDSGAIRLFNGTNYEQVTRAACTQKMTKDMETLVAADRLYGTQRRREELGVEWSGGSLREQIKRQKEKR
ncbi:MAG TPA: hypothetical protein VGP72_03780 [Planctomycetota bacterium]|jgi:hypothetical protein